VYVYGVVRVYGVCVYSVGSLGGCGVCVCNVCVCGVVECMCIMCV